MFVTRITQKVGGVGQRRALYSSDVDKGPESLSLTLQRRFGSICSCVCGIWSSNSKPLIKKRMQRLSASGSKHKSGSSGFKPVF